MLHGMEKKGYLTSRHERTGRRDRRVYEITNEGRTAMTNAKAKVGDSWHAMTACYSRSSRKSLPTTSKLAPMSANTAIHIAPMPSNVAQEKRP